MKNRRKYQHPSTQVPYGIKSNPQPLIFQILLDEKGDQVSTSQEPIFPNLKKFPLDPEYVKLEIHLDEKGKPMKSNAHFECSIGSEFGITLLILDPNGIEVSVTQSIWRPNASFIENITQNPKRSKAYIHKIGTTAHVEGPSNTFAFKAPGQVEVMVTGTTRFGDIEGEFSINVVAPNITNIHFEAQNSPRIFQDDKTIWLKSTPFKTYASCRTKGYPGTAGFIQFLNYQIVRNSVDNKSEKLKTEERIRATTHNETSETLCYGEEHIAVESEKSLQYLRESSDFELSSTLPKNKELISWNQYQVNTNLETFICFQPDASTTPGIISTFLVIYKQQYLSWNWLATTTSIGGDWKLQDTKSDNNAITTNDLWDIPMWDNSHPDIFLLKDWKL